MVKRDKMSMPVKENDLMHNLVALMEVCPDAESLNNEVLIPFAAALETVCGARGYVLNIYGETSNIIFTGDSDDSEEIFKFTDVYLASRDESIA